tara:strand:+ start:939 stop:2543 length:1605 start_codon:yes stop_codon:yes gene_type:complete
MKSNKLNENTNLIILASLIFSIKPLEFLAINFSVANFSEDLFYPMIFHLAIFVFYIILFSIFLRFKYVFANKFFIFLAAAYYLQYFVLDLRDFLISVTPSLFNQNMLLLISMALIVLISAGFTKLYFSSINKNIFILGSLLLCLTQIGILITNSINSIDKPVDYELAEDNNVEDQYEANTITGENVYYIILDGLVSYEYFTNASKIENKEFSNFNSFLEDYNFRVFEDSLSSYNITFLTLGSILEMNYYDENLSYKNRDQFFPKLLYKNTPPRLIKRLNNIGYNFIYSGNFWAQCKNSLNFSCANRIINYDTLSTFERLINFTSNAGIQTLTSRSILGFILRKISSIVGSSFYDDGLENFLESGIDDIKPNTKKFYFIHNESPHPPYPEKNCKIDHTKSYTGWISMEAYSFSISCALEKATYTIDRIIQLDPSAIIVVQGDHGTSLNYDWMTNPLEMNKEQLKERYSIYNSMRLPERCNSSSSRSLGNVETINLVYDCISNKKETTISNRSFAAVYEDNREHFGKLYEVTDNLK